MFLTGDDHCLLCASRGTIQSISCIYLVPTNPSLKTKSVQNASSSISISDFIQASVARRGPSTMLVSPIPEGFLCSVTVTCYQPCGPSQRIFCNSIWVFHSMSISMPVNGEVTQPWYQRLQQAFCATQGWNPRFQQRELPLRQWGVVSDLVVSGSSCVFASVHQ